MLQGCIAPRNFRLPKDRITRGTPYVLPDKEIEVGLKLLGQESDDLAAALELKLGIANRLELGVNLAHAAFGVLNVNAKLCLADRKWWGLAFRTGVLWVHPKAVWALPADDRSALGDIDLLAAPFELIIGSIPLKWLGLSLTAGYLHASLFGTLHTETTLFDGSIGARKLYVTPQIDLFAIEKLHLFLRAHLPVLIYVRDELVSEILVAKGLYAGVRSAEWNEIDHPIRRAHGVFGLDVKFGHYTRVELFAVVRGPLTRSDIVRMPVLPGVGIYWQF